MKRYDVMEEARASWPKASKKRGGSTHVHGRPEPSQLAWPSFRSWPQQLRGWGWLDVIMLRREGLVPASLAEDTSALFHKSLTKVEVLYLRFCEDNRNASDELQLDLYTYTPTSLVMMCSSLLLIVART
eukprot:scaffold1912_cov160-Skeletonema_dohrnii-CCMP3373.AAC.2